jgi:hypothetical protein
MTRRVAALIAGLFIAVAALVGCSHSAPVSYAPAAYGVQAGSVYDCYWVYGAAEVDALIAHGYCPVGSVATRMPDSYLNMYFSYYDSPSYYDTFVPSPVRTVYVSTYHTYYVQHTAVITTASKSATWKGSNGKTVSGASVNTAKMKFSTGSGSTSKMGGGSLRGGSFGGSGGGSSGKSPTVKAGTGSGGSSTVKSKTGSVGGGSLRGRK